MIKKKLIKMIRANAIESTKGWKTIKIEKDDPELLPMMNHRCHFNALNEYRAKRAVAILEVLNPDDNTPTAHYINIDAQGRAYDATLGWSWAGVEYRLSKYIHTMDVDDMSKHLYGFKQRLFDMSPPWLQKSAKAIGITLDDCF